jgi:hypothetical protein
MTFSCVLQPSANFLQLLLLQELIVYALQHGLPLPPLHPQPTHSNSSSSDSVTHPHQLPQPASPASAATAILAAAAGTGGSSRPIAASYVAEMLRKVSPEQLQSVQSWSGEEDLKKLTQVS